jgi:hypothetical protein
MELAEVIEFAAPVVAVVNKNQVVVNFYVSEEQLLAGFGQTAG